jgi:hypothetical protein
VFQVKGVVAIGLHHDDLASAENLLSLPFCRVVGLPDSFLVSEATAIVGLGFRVGVTATRFSRMLKGWLRLVFGFCRQRRNDF